MPSCSVSFFRRVFLSPLYSPRHLFLVLGDDIGRVLALCERFRSLYFHLKGERMIVFLARSRHQTSFLFSLSPIKSVEKAEKKKKRTWSLSSSSAATTASDRDMSKSSTLVATASSKSAWEARGFGGGGMGSRFFSVFLFKCEKMNEREKMNKGKKIKKKKEAARLPVIFLFVFLCVFFLFRRRNLLCLFS